MKTVKSNPPRLALRFFRWYCHPRIQDYIEGDLMEVHQRRVKALGKRKADIRFIFDVILLCRPGIIKPAEGYRHLNQYGMFKNYFKVGIRNILKYKAFSFINIFGLAVAMSVCMLIILMLADQKEYDQFHEKKDRIYRVLTKRPSSFKPNASSPFPLASTIRSDYPVVEEATHLVPGVGGDALYNQQTVEMRGFFADEAFFKVFSYELIEGNKDKALTSPRSMVITSEIAQKLFGDENPIGKTVEFTNRGLNHLMMDGESTPSRWGAFMITGVMDASKYKSHIKFGVLLSSSSMESLYAEGKFRNMTDNWQEYSNCYTYVVLHPEATASDLTIAVNDLANRKYKNLEELKGLKLLAQGMEEITPGIFLGNPISFSLPIEVYYFLGLLALVIMISAAMNYTNLSTARALTRTKEIGVRKVTGANRGDLIYQFLSESIMISFLALMVAYILLLVMKPAFRGLWVNRYLNFELQENITIYLVFAVFALVIGIVAGLYPAFHLSGYQPIKAIQKTEKTRTGKGGVQKFLSILQFIVSLLFITTAVLMYNQFRYHLSIDYGFSANQIINIKLQGNDYSKIANGLSTVPGIIGISACDYLPATGTQNGTALKDAGSEKEYVNLTALLTDEHFADNLELKIVAGKNLPSGQSSDRFILINESAVRKFGFQNSSEVVGHVMEQYGTNALLEVIGVIEDFRFRMPSEQEEIAPLMIRNLPSEFRYANVKLARTDDRATLMRLEETWKKIDPVHPIRYEFYDEQLANTNKAFVDIVSIIGFIAFLAIVIACLGLLGMATYTTERKMKEVSIRKILGAENRSIALLLSKGFMRMLLVAVFIGTPVSYFINNLWLEHLPNRVAFGWGTLFIAVFILLLLGLITIGSQTIRVWKNNPVDALKAE